MSASQIIHVTLPDGSPPRLDKALARAVPEDAALSRSRLQVLIATGAVCREAGEVVTDAKAKVAAGDVWVITVPEAVEGRVEAQDIPLVVIYEDDALIVVDKPAGMVVHPAPGAWDGTLVNALLHHCGDSLSGIGGEKRPGIVHRIDKDTSGLLVVAKTDAAHHGLAAQFEDHSANRSYIALIRGVPQASDPRLVGLRSVSFEAGGVLKIDAPIARHPHDRKKMAVKTDGRHAVTRVHSVERHGPVSLVRCRLETGRTHQIRVHLSHVGFPLIGDPVYGKSKTLPKNMLSGAAINALKEFPRQALHAETLGFKHPGTGELLQFSSDIPQDFNSLLTLLQEKPE